MHFASDNWAGVPNEIATALAAAAQGIAPAYGGAAIDERIQSLFCDVFEASVNVQYVATGRAANGIALGMNPVPGAVVYCHEEAHIRVDEVGVVQFQLGAGQIIGLPSRPSEMGKIDSDCFEEALSGVGSYRFGDGEPVALSITQGTEAGTVYSLEEIKVLTDLAHRHNMIVHMDGARFANALAALGCSPAEMTWKAGVDVLSFGATKNGCWCADAIINFGKLDARRLRRGADRAGHVLSKSVFISTQFEAYLTDENWLKWASHANKKAAKLRAGLEASQNARLAWPSDINESFVIMDKSTAKRLEEAGASFHEWPHQRHMSQPPSKNEVLLRLVTSFRTSDEEVENFLKLLEG